MNKTKNILKIVVEIILLIIIVFIGITTFGVKKTSSNPNNKGLFNISPVIVESSSMEPTIKKNDLVLVKYSDNIADYKEGKIAVFVTEFYGQYYTVVHRVKSINKDGTITFRGDANLVDDNPVSLNSVKGYVILTLPGLGSFINVLVKNNLLYWLIVLVYVALVVFMNYDSLNKKIKNNKSKAITKKEETIEVIKEEVKETEPQVIEENKEVQIVEDIKPQEEEIKTVEVIKPQVEETKVEEVVETKVIEEIKEEVINTVQKEQEPNLEKEVEAILNGEKPKITKKLSELDLNSLQEFIFNKPKNSDDLKKKLLRRRDTKDINNNEIK